MYVLIEGVYHVVHMSPDADSIKFKANNPAHWDKVHMDNRQRFERKFKDDNEVVTIRLEAIDALETHYNPPSVPAPKGMKTKLKKVEKPSKGKHRQHEQLGELATNIFLDFMGVSEVKWRKTGYATYIDYATINGQRYDDKFQDAIPGYVITDSVEKHGRPLGWVFAGKPPVADGTALSKAAVGDLIQQSANYHLIERGTVYPFFYKTLPGAIRIPIIDAAKKAQQNPDQDDVWLHDRTIDGIKINSLEALYGDTVILPYLFRRIVRLWHTKIMQDFYDKVKNDKGNLPDGSDLSLNFDNFFEEANPGVFVVSTQDFVYLSDVMEASGNSLKMHVYPYDMVFLS